MTTKPPRMPGPTDDYAARTAELTMQAWDGDVPQYSFDFRGLIADGIRRAIRPSANPLSERIRPNAEAAPWVIEEVRRLEARIASLERADEVTKAEANVPDNWRAAVQDFVNRCERGEIRSRQSYATFKALLDGPAPEPAPLPSPDFGGTAVLNDALTIDGALHYKVAYNGSGDGFIITNILSNRETSITAQAFRSLMNLYNRERWSDPRTAARLAQQRAEWIHFAFDGDPNAHPPHEYFGGGELDRSVFFRGHAPTYTVQPNHESPHAWIITDRQSQQRVEVTGAQMRDLVDLYRLEQDALPGPVRDQYRSRRRDLLVSWFAPEPAKPTALDPFAVRAACKFGRGDRQYAAQINVDVFPHAWIVYSHKDLRHVEVEQDAMACLVDLYLQECAATPPELKRPLYERRRALIASWFANPSA